MNFDAPERYQVCGIFPLIAIPLIVGDTIGGLPVDLSLSMD